jgi:hypothetical protein
MPLIQSNQQKLEIFFEVAGELNEKFDIEPILFGSLGLYRLIGDSGKTANDVDFLVPEELINEKWEEFRRFIESLGFKLENEKDREFSRGEEMVSFGKVEELAQKFNFNMEDFLNSKIRGVRFKEFTVDQYLTFYRVLERDAHRQEKLGKNDKEKIRLIEYFIKNK